MPSLITVFGKVRGRAGYFKNIAVNRELGTGKRYHT